jgi:hypothetical protein
LATIAKQSLLREKFLVLGMEIWLYRDLDSEWLNSSHWDDDR